MADNQACSIHFDDIFAQIYLFPFLETSLRTAVSKAETWIHISGTKEAVIAIRFLNVAQNATNYDEVKFSVKLFYHHPTPSHTVKCESKLYATETN